ncbi:hypothetical protein BHYA_0467g00030 [Botrytis hyacinthi]|uniref:NAD-dependent epimerase/dehydratase domain-containing protein n=1 Tax=Botrytis hyacinthi TaxID=278943 RepID=A0A4Z1GC85_9HELO|nr:hypothetical protein BHYA_0467g00030 [Botrytis hyacinthi]
MTKVLLTGGSSFIGAHILEILLLSVLQLIYNVVLAVRTESKGQEILNAYPKSNELSYVVTGNFSKLGVFDNALQSDPPFDAVIHSASPFHFRSTDHKKDILEPAINGIVGILKAIKQHAPSAKKVVITSSMATVMKPFSAPVKYTAEDWNPVTEEQALSNSGLAYLGSKIFAERSAWEFIKKELPSVGLATINPPAVLGPVIHHLKSLADINTSNAVIADLMQGKWKNGAPLTFTKLWVDVRDVALAYVNALEIPEAVGRRFLLNGGYVTNADYVAIAKKNPLLKDKLPETVDKEEITDPEVDIELAKEILDIKFRSLEESITDTITSLQRFVE